MLLPAVLPARAARRVPRLVCCVTRWGRRHSEWGVCFHQHASAPGSRVPHSHGCGMGAPGLYS